MRKGTADKRILFVLLLPAAFFLLSFFLRTSGLSHDLHLGKIYHPDTPKQIHAVGSFLDDRFGLNYYTNRGHPDYDGYPFFNSHLVEYLYRIYDKTREFTLWHIGIPYTEFHPERRSIYWTTRLLNSFLSALAVVLVYFMGMRHFGRTAGILAACFLMLSPVDITTSNYATSDSTAAFFALLAVFFALRITDSPRAYYYACGAVAAAFAFSAKYYGGMALVSLGVAHLFTFANEKKVWRTLRFWGYGLLLPVSFVIGVIFSSPALLIYPSGAFYDIINFISFTANYRLTEEVQTFPLVTRFMLAMRLNLPHLADFVGWVTLFAVFAGVIWFRKSPQFWVTISLPVFFLVVGVTMKPLTHPDYYVVAIPLLFLASAAFLAALLQGKTGKIPSRIFSFVMISYALAYLGNYAWQEIFFFRHNDTRQVAETWVIDTLPREFLLHTGAHTQFTIPWDHNHLEHAGTAYALSDRHLENPENTSLVHQISFEQTKLSRNRNRDMRFVVEDNPVLSPTFSLPVIKRAPSSRQDNIIVAHAPALIKSPKVIDVAHGQSRQATLVSPLPLKRCALILHGSAYPADVSVRFAGNKHRVMIEPYQNVVLFFDSPRSLFLSRNTNSFYRLELKSVFNLEPVRAVIAVSDLEIARELYLAQEFEKAYSYFLLAAPEKLNISEKIAKAISGLATGILDDSQVKSIIGPELNRLVFKDTFASEPYEVLDSFDDNWFLNEFGVHPKVFERLSPCHTRTTILDSVHCQIKLLRALLSHEPEASFFASEQWQLAMLRGNALESQGRHEQAFKFFKAAMILDPEKRAPYEAVRRMGKFFPERIKALDGRIHPFIVGQQKEKLNVNIRFANNLIIRQVQLNSLTFERGQQLEGALFWEMPKLRPNLHRLMYRVKLTENQTGSVVFDEHYFVLQSLKMQTKRDDYSIRPQIIIPFDEAITAGTYTLSIALVEPQQNRTVRIASPKRPGERKYSKIVQISVDSRVHDVSL